MLTGDELEASTANNIWACPAISAMIRLWLLQLQLRLSLLLLRLPPLLLSLLLLLPQQLPAAAATEVAKGNSSNA